MTDNSNNDPPQTSEKKPFRFGVDYKDGGFPVSNCECSRRDFSVYDDCCETCIMRVAQVPTPDSLEFPAVGMKYASSTKLSFRSVKVSSASCEITFGRCNDNRTLARKSSLAAGRAVRRIVCKKKCDSQAQLEPPHGLQSQSRYSLGIAHKQKYKPLMA